MSFEDAVAELHENLFLREFTFSTATFVPPGGTQLELADSIIAIGSELAVVQVKERSPPLATTPQQERRWFQKKVLGDATRQVRDTIAYLRQQGVVSVANRRGLPVGLDVESVSSLHRIVLYRATDLLPRDCQSAKHHMSRSIGLIHLFDSVEYLRVVTTLVTPREFFDYLAFRSETILTWGDLPELPEQALLGQYLSGRLTSQPDIRYSGFLSALVTQKQKWDMSGIMRAFGDRITSTGGSPKDYYLVIQELAELTRAELQQFKERFTLSVENARTGKTVQPYRMAIPRTGCGFVFVAFTGEQVNFAQEGLLKLTLAHKYDQKLQKCVGMAVWRDGEDYLILWSFTDFAWKSDPEMERFAAESGVLSKVRTAEVARYEFEPRN